VAGPATAIAGHIVGRVRWVVLAAVLVGALGCRAEGAGAAPSRRADAVTARPAWVLVVHGGAGDVHDTEAELGIRSRGLEAALRRGGEILDRGGSSLDAVEAAVIVLEDDPVFNAGRGAVFTHAGTHELDAAIMDGRDHRAGAVAAVRTVRNPIGLARLVMERTPHVLLVGDGAEAFAGSVGVERVANSWFDTPQRRRQLEEEIAKGKQTVGGGTGTVGAVALDRAGHLAAATSTGGTTDKLPGRVGDSPIIGAGTWADDATCAVSATGHGEALMRGLVAGRVAMSMEDHGWPLARAAADVLGRLEKDAGGFIAVAHDGTVAMPFNSQGMFRGVMDGSGRLEVAVWPR
jgi:beta-aspartyl-peptidase (threonine type)